MRLLTTISSIDSPSRKHLLASLLFNESFSGFIYGLTPKASFPVVMQWVGWRKGHRSTRAAPGTP